MQFPACWILSLGPVVFLHMNLKKWMMGYQTSASNDMNSLDTNRFAEVELPSLCPLAAYLELWDRRQTENKVLSISISERPSL